MFFLLKLPTKLGYGDVTMHALSNTGLRVHFSSYGQWSISPFPSPLFSLQVGHSCLSVLPLSLDKNIVHAS